MRQKIDQLLNSWVSKKLTVFLTATLLTLFGKVVSHDWVNIAIVYIGSQSVVDIFKQININRK